MKKEKLNISKNMEINKLADIKKITSICCSDIQCMEVALYSENKPDQKAAAFVCIISICSGEYWIIYIVSNI